MTYVTRLRGADLTPGEYMVLMTVWTYTDEKMLNAFPSVSRLAEDTGLSRRTVQRCMGSLRAKGYLSIDARGGNIDGKNLATRYRLNLPTGGGDTHDAPGCHERRPGGDTGDALSDPSSDHESDPSYTSDPGGSDLSEVDTVDPDGSPVREIANSPVSPEFQLSAEKKQILEAVQDLALAHKRGMYDIEEVIENWLDVTFEEVLGTDVIPHAIHDQGWMPPTKVIGNRYEAGVWLNKLLHWTAANHIDSFTYTAGAMTPYPITRSAA